jgi:hypothetical protein
MTNTTVTLYYVCTSGVSLGLTWKEGKETLQEVGKETIHTSYITYVNKNTNSYQFPQTFNKHNKEIVFERVELVDSEHSLCLV